jgi:hypothetical protein
LRKLEGLVEQPLEGTSYQERAAALRELAELKKRLGG